MALTRLIALLQDAAPAAGPEGAQSTIRIIAGVGAVVLVAIIILRRRSGKKKEEEEF
jgi:hypothetical protein